MYEIQFFDKNEKYLFKLRYEGSFDEAVDFACAVCRYCGIPATKHNALVIPLDD